MIIKRLTIHAFGKFNNKEIIFEPGLNVIQGDNEAGKSTIHAFIEAMFFGFYKAYSKNRLYESAYDHYLPWDHNGYSGHLTFEDGGKVIRLERQFTKGKDDFKVYNALTGEDITQTYDYNKVTKLYDISQKHIGFNKVAYRNTISLTQMQTRTEEELIREIKDNMSNLASSRDSNISIEKVIREIELKENRIGSSRKKASPYYKLKQKIKKLNEELKVSHEVYEEILTEKTRENNLEESLDSIKEREKGIKDKIDNLKAFDNNALIVKVKGLEKEIEDLRSKSSSLSLYKDFDLGASTELQKDKEVLGDQEHELQDLKSKRALKLEQYHHLNEKKRDTIDLETVVKQYEKVHKAIQDYEKERFVQRDLLNELKLIESQQMMKGSVPQYKRPIGLYGAIGLVAIISILTGILIKHILLGGAALSLAVMAYVFYMDKQHHTQHIEQQKKRDNFIGHKNQLLEQIKSRQKHLERILANMGVATINELSQIKDQLLVQQSHGQLKEKDYKDVEAQNIILKKEIIELEEKINTVQGRYDQLSISYRAKLDRYNIVDSDNIQEALEKHLAYKTCIRDIETKKIQMQEILGNRKIEVLEKQLGDVNITFDKGEDHDALLEALSRMGEERLKVEKQISQAQTRGIELAKSCKGIASLEEELEETEALMKDYEHQLKVVQVMKMSIEEIAQEIQNNFAPVLNEALSEVVGEISGDKYFDIKVNPQMALTVFDQKLNRTVKAEALSQGTIDMLYFGLRLGIAKVLSDQRELPLILDDAFVQYDDKRLANVIDFLIGQERQVLLFTCHNREIEHMTNEEYRFNRIHI